MAAGDKTLEGLLADECEAMARTRPNSELHQRLAKDARRIADAGGVPEAAADLNQAIDAAVEFANRADVVAAANREIPTETDEKIRCPLCFQMVWSMEFEAHRCSEDFDEGALADGLAAAREE